MNLKSITGQQSNKFNKNSSNQQKQNDKTDESLGLKRIYVGGLTDHLADLKEQDIKEVHLKSLHKFNKK